MPETPKPPEFARRILLRFLRDDLAEEVAGDLEENFFATVKAKSPWRAKLNYWYQVVHYFRSFALRRAWSSNANIFTMYRSYFKTAYRNMVKNKLHSFINVTGLSVGMSVAITIGLWIWDELSFNKSHERYARVAQVIQNVTNNGEVQTWRNTPYPLAEELRKNYGSDFEQVILSTNIFGHLIDANDQKINQPGLYAEPSITEILSLKMIQGTSDALKDPSTVLISASTAKTFFGEADPINQIIKIDELVTVHVAGVYEDIPESSQFSRVAFVSSWEALYANAGWIQNMSDPWRPNGFATYVILKEHSVFASASAKIKNAKLNKVNKELAKKKPELFLDPMSRWHLYGEFKDGKNTGGRIRYVWMFGIIGSFVLLMACINFMNLSTARSEKRAKEVGIRKAIGSLRGQLISQFFSESLLMAFLALVCALLLVQLILPVFNQIADKHMALLWSTPVFWLLCAGFTLFTGLIAGSYPALYLSSLRTGMVLKGLTVAGGAATIPRKVLVVVQFTVSVVLIIGTAVVFRQIQFAKNRPLGYENNGLVAVPVSSDAIHKHLDVIKAELEKDAVITGIAEAGGPTTESWSSSSGFDWQGKDPDLSVDFPVFSVSHDYGKTIGWELAEGRDFSRAFLSDSSAVIVNEAAVRFMELKEPVGEILRWREQPMRIVGVIKDMITASPYDEVKPAVFFLANYADNYVVFKIDPRSSASSALSRIEETLKKYHPGLLFDYQFMDDAYARKFGNEERVGRLSGYFAGLAIFISCLGIFGLASFVAEQRTKEIGVRKVLGASIFDLWKLLSKDFVLLVTFSCAVAAPIAWYFLSEWLQEFTYRTAIPLWIFIAASVATLVITLATVSFHSIHAARMNPVKSLRTE